MRYWKTCYITCFIFVLIPLTLYGQEDVEQLQKLDKLMFSGRYFESKELYKKISETTTFPSDLELYYKFRMAQFLNKTDSVAYYLEQFIPHHYATFGEETLVFYSNLFDAYIELGDTDKALDTYLQMKRIWNESLTKTTTGGKEYEEWRTATENFLSYAEYAVTLPSIKMKRNDTLSFVDIEEGDRLVFQAKYNGILQRTIFDTGVGPYCVLSRKLADGMGVRYDSIDENKVTINEDLISVRSIIDSVEVGNITFYNIPAFIYSDTASVPFVSGSSIKRRKKRKKAQIVVDSVRTLFTDCVSLGLPVMKLIGKIQTDYEHNKMCFPVSVANAHLPKAPNIYAYKYDLYMRIKLNGVAFTANLDTGSNEYVTVDSAFYEKHQKELPIASTCKKNTFGVVMLHQARAITYKTLKDPAIIFDDKLMQPPGPEAVKTYPLGQIVPGIFFDGVIGNGFYRRIGKKVLLDLDNMRLEAVQ
jgi:pentatricopeptide repeat protein